MRSLTHLPIRLHSLVDDMALLPLVSALVSRLSVYVTLIVTAHLLDAEQFGTYAVSLVAVGILSALVTGGGDMWLNRFTGELATTTGQAPRLWLPYFSVVLFVSLILISVAMLIELSGYLPRSFAGVALTTVIVSALIGLTETVLATMRASGAIRSFFIVRDIVAPLAYLAVMMGFGPTTTIDALLAYLGLWAVAFIGVVAYLVRRAPTMLPAIRPPRLARLPVLRHTLGLIYGNLTSRLAIYIDVLVLTTVTSIVVIGEYRVAAQFAIGFMVIQHFVFLGLPWQMRSRGRISGGGPGLAVVAERQRSLLLVAAAGGVFLWILADPLLRLFGDRFSEMTPIFRILLVTRFSSLLWGPQHETLISNGLSIEDAHASLASICIWIIAFPVFLIFIGPVYSALFATLLSTLALHLTRLWILHRHLLPSIYGHPFGPVAPIVVFALIALATYLQTK